MEQPNGNPCPECGAPRNRDNTPSCACTRRASDALRDARTAEAAAAEDFDPLRIRPYVELDGGSGRSTPDGAEERPEAAGAAAPGSGPAPGAPDETMPLRAVPPEAAVPGGTDAASALPTPLGPATTRPSATDLNLFDGTQPIARVPDGHAPDAHAPDDGGGAPPRRRRRGALLAVGGAVVLVVGAAGWASGMFSYETPSRDGAAPREVRASVPDASSEEPSEEPTAGASTASPTSSASPSASPSASASTSASPSPSASSTSPTPTAPAEPSATPTSASPSAGAPQESGEDDPAGSAPVLRRGDRGPEVTELQQRLNQLYLYNDDINGQFNRRVEDALRNYQWSRGIREDLGVYGPQTRSRLETETREP
ncbi:peptidoglycan-binding domain-containing protein [Streptomyces griseoflavus]|uniref:peptidoglycan-binding domain-containing protein n=1 Tax=Streptomyces griseoflavus TaxID=35619 RepID=UPI0033BB1681